MEQGINHVARFTPEESPTPPSTARDLSAVAAPNEMTISLSAGYAGRAAVAEDTTRLGSSAMGAFLPSAIPVAGQQFFGSRDLASVQGTGSTLNLFASNSGSGPLASTPGTLSNPKITAGITVLATGSDNSVSGAPTIQQAYGQINKLLIGLTETAFADSSALPETLDFAGPNARVTIFQAGQGMGQGRLSYYLVSDGLRSGFSGNLSAEAPMAEIQNSITGTTVTGKNTATVASVPDVITTWRFAQGTGEETKYVEDWHIQFGTLARSLGIENDTNNTNQYAFGWGTSLSGACRIPIGLSVRDCVYWSVTYGEGIAHYINDLRTAPTDLKNGGNDAIVNAGGNLIPLPALAWYTGYTHNWSDFWRSTTTYSHVGLNDPANVGNSASPLQYHNGTYVAVNLIHHEVVGPPNDLKNDHVFFYGLEYLYGQKETLNGALAHDNRVMFVTSISK